ncbi:MAG: hypothetical protein VX519_09465 [Myxococcota bacterium]|nr:hypothetical protein [Myxococcota bacterium]
MARVRVEDIQQQSRETQLPVSTAPVHFESIKSLARPLPGPATAWLIVGTLSMLFGYFTHYRGFAAWLSPENMTSLSMGFIRASIPTICLGSAFIGLGMIKLQWQRLQRSNAIPTAARERLITLLNNAEPQWTVESLVRESGMGEANLVRSLAALERSGEITEELDTETGEYFYRIADPKGGRPLSLQERLAEQGDDP